MRTIVWNVNGLHRKLADTDFLDFLKFYDIVFLSETWASEKHLTNLSIQGFKSVHVFDKKKYRCEKNICHTYIPPPRSKVFVDKDFDFFEEIEKGIEKYNNLGKTFITGDLNSRTGQLSDILQSDKYLDDDDDDDDVRQTFTIIRRSCL